MSNTLYGSPSSIEKVKELASIVKGIPPVSGKLPITLPSIIGQRATKSTTLQKFIESENGFNWSLWRWPSVVQVDANVAKEYQRQMAESGNFGDVEFAKTMDSGFLSDGFWYARWDGDHRTKLWEMTFPNDKVYDCMIYPVTSVEVANQLFVKIQKLNVKNLSPEDTKINLYYGKDENAQRLAELLDYCGLCIKNSNEGIMPSSATRNTPSTRIRIFEECVDKVGIEETKLAAEILIKKLSKNPKWNKEVAPTLLKGLALVFKVRPNTRKNGLHRAVIEYLYKCMDAIPRQKDLIKFYAAEAGNTHMKEPQCIAYGFIRKLLVNVRSGDIGSSPSLVQSLEGIRTLEEDLGLTDDYAEELGRRADAIITSSKKN